MLFNSLDFAIFLPVVFACFWYLGRYNLKIQNLFILAASLLFYGWWDWRFLLLLVFSTSLDFFVSLGLASTENSLSRKLLLSVSLVCNLGLLAVFKYLGFFVDSFVKAFNLLGGSMNLSSLNIILPVGISFYTFQSLSYSIDVYRRKMAPTRDYFSYLAFVSFFPQLVAGPIERATNLLPQFSRHRVFDYEKAINGTKQILWGFVKKIVIADNCAIYANL